MVFLFRMLYAVDPIFITVGYPKVNARILAYLKANLQWFSFLLIFPPRSMLEVDVGPVITPWGCSISRDSSLCVSSLKPRRLLLSMQILTVSYGACPLLTPGPLIPVKTRISRRHDLQLSIQCVHGDGGIVTGCGIRKVLENIIWLTVYIPERILLKVRYGQTRIPILLYINNQPPKKHQLLQLRLP